MEGKKITFPLAAPEDLPPQSTFAAAPADCFPPPAPQRLHLPPEPPSPSSLQANPLKDRLSGPGGPRNWFRDPSP